MLLSKVKTAAAADLEFCQQEGELDDLKTKHFPHFLNRRLVILLFHFLCAVEETGVRYMSCCNLIFVIGP